MKVYEDMRGAYIKINKPCDWPAGTEFVVLEQGDVIKLVRLENGNM